METLKSATCVAILGASLWTSGSSAATVYSNDFESSIAGTAGAGVTPGWSLTGATANLAIDTARNDSTHYLGRDDGTGSDSPLGYTSPGRRGFGSTDVLTLTLSGLPSNGTLNLSFDFFTLLGWNGNGDNNNGVDRFRVDFNFGAGSIDLVDNTFSNFPSPETNDGNPGTPANLTSTHMQSYCPGTSAPCAGRTGSDLGQPNPLGNQDAEGGSALYHFNFESLSYFGTEISLAFFGQSLSEFLSIESWAIDNINVTSPVPMPPALPLLGTALLGLVGIARRRA